LPWARQVHQRPATFHNGSTVAGDSAATWFQQTGSYAE
jgi:hypothetical protein